MADVNNMKTFKLFPTIITGFELDIDEYDKKNMLGYIQQHQRPGRRWKYSLTQTEDDLHTMSFFKYFREQVIEMNEKVISDLGYEYESLIITSMWGNNLASGGIHTPHTHSNNFLSGVFYLKTDSSSAPIQFFDPRPQAGVLIPRKKQMNDANTNMVSFSAKENTGFIFPSWLQHWVQPSDSKERVSISWNILVKGEYGEPHTLQNAYI